MQIYNVCDFHLLKSKHSMSQCSRQRLTCYVRRRKHRFEIQRRFLIHLFHPMNKIYLFRKNVLIRYKSSDSIVYLTFWVKIIFHPWHLCIIKQIKNELWNWSFNPMLSKTSSIKSVFAQFTVTSNVLTVTDKNHKQCIFQILSVNVPRS